MTKNISTADVHQLVARWDDVRDGRLRQHTCREVRQKRQVPDDWGRPRTRRTTLARAPSTTCTAWYLTYRGAACSLPTAPTIAFRSSTKTGSISISGPRKTVHAAIPIQAADGYLWIADGFTAKVMKFDLDGHLLYEWGSEGDWPGALWNVHGMSVDQEGNLYLAEVNNGRAEKFRPRPGANPALMVGKPVYPPGNRRRGSTRIRRTLDWCSGLVLGIVSGLVFEPSKATLSSQISSMRSSRGARQIARPRPGLRVTLRSSRVKSPCKVSPCTRRIRSTMCIWSLSGCPGRSAKAFRSGQQYRQPECRLPIGRWNGRCRSASIIGSRMFAPSI